MMKQCIKQLGGWGGVILGVLTLSGCAVVSVDHLGNRKHTGLMWVKQGTADKGQVDVVIIKSLGLEAGICPTGVGLMLGYKNRLFAWPTLSNDSSSSQSRFKYDIDEAKNMDNFGFMTVTVPAHQDASLQGSSQTGASFSTCSDYPLVGLGYQSKTQIQYDRNGKAYFLNYTSGKPSSILFHVIDPTELPKKTADIIN